MAGPAWSVFNADDPSLTSAAKAANQIKQAFAAPQRCATQTQRPSDSGLYSLYFRAFGAWTQDQLVLAEGHCQA